MKVLLITAALVASTLCAAPAAPAAPAPPAGWTPSGRLLLVPARQEAYPPPAEFPKTTAQPETNGTRVAQESESDESQSEKLVESGEYYVLLPDGRLQMVKYATAALKTSEESDPKEPQNDQGAQYNAAAEGADYFQQQKFQQAVYYIQAQEEQKETQNQQYNNAQGPYKFEQPAAYYVQAQEEQKESQNEQYNSAQGPFKFQQQKFQPAAYPVFIRPAQQEQTESAQYKNAAESNFQQTQYPVYQQPQRFSADSKFQQVKQEPSNFQLEFVQFPLQGSEQFTQTKLQLSEPKSAQNKAEEKSDDEDASGFEAKVQYRDVKPISAPIYAYNPTPLVRILKK